MSTAATHQEARLRSSSGQTLADLGPTIAAMGGALALFFVWFFHRWFLKQHEFSANSIEDWGHAYVVPLISGYMVWQRRAELARVVPRPFWAGLPPMLLGIMCYIYFTTGLPNHMFQGAAMLLTLFGVVLLVLGNEAMRLLFLPIAFLSLGVTISEQIMTEVTFPLQIVASQGASILLGVADPLLGTTTMVSGNLITVFEADGTPHELNVAEACSGMRMVVAFIALSAAVAILGSNWWWKRVMVLWFAVPVAVLVNVFRVGVLGLLTLVDPELAKGQAHTLVGTLLLVPGLGLFLLVVWTLDRVVVEPEPKT